MISVLTSPSPNRSCLKMAVFSTLTCQKKIGNSVTFLSNRVSKIQNFEIITCMISLFEFCFLSCLISVVEIPGKKYFFILKWSSIREVSM